MTIRVTEDTIYKATLLGKGLLGMMQLFAAMGIWLGAPDQIPRLAQWLVQAELAEDQTDYFAVRIIALAERLPGADLSFYAIYFVLHGLLHIGIVIALLRGAAWAHRWAVIVLMAFVVYQMADWFLKGGVALLILSAIDIFVIVVTLRGTKRSAASGR